MPVPNPVQGPRPLTRAQRAQNRRFLDALARTGNARLAARELGLNRSTFTKRRAKHPTFAALWEAALELAQVRLARAAREFGPLSSSPMNRPPCPRHGSGLLGAVRTGSFPGERDRVKRGGGAPSGRDRQSPTRTSGGEPTILRLRNGRLQLRRAAPGRMTAAAEQLFLATLAETNNIRLAAAAAGFAHSSPIARRRRSPAFAARMEEAAAAAPQAIERHLARAAAALDEHLARIAAEAPGWPRGMTVAQVLHQLGAPPLKLPGTPFPGKTGRK